MAWFRTWLGDMKARSWFLVLVVGTNLLYWVLPRLSLLSMSYVVLPFALILLAVQLTKREIRWNFYVANLFIMAAFYIVAWACNLDLSYRTMFTLILSCVSMTIAGVIPEKYPAKTLKAETLTIAALLLALMTLLSVLGMISVFVGRKMPFLWKKASVGILTDGMPDARLFLLMHPNAAATMCSMAIMLAIHWLYNHPPRGLKVVLICAIVPLTFAIIHCQSRGNNIALAAGVGALVFRALYLRGFRGGKRVWVALAAGCVAFFCVLGLFNVVFKIDMRIASLSLKKEEVGDAVSRTVTDGTFDMFSNGRDIIWRTSLRYLLKHPSKLLLGMGAGDTVPTIRAEFPEMLDVTHMHNAFLETLARGGLPVFLSVLAMLVMLVKPCLALLVAQETEENRGLHVLVVMIGMLLMISIVEVGLFTYANPRNTLFFYAAGRVMRAYSPAGATELRKRR